jgi:hypothetical protein
MGAPFLPCQRALRAVILAPISRIGNDGDHLDIRNAVACNLLV